MSQLLKRRGEAEHAIKELESLYTQTVVPSSSNHSCLAVKTLSVEHFVLHFFYRSLQQISGKEFQTNTAGSALSWTQTSA